MTPGDDDLLSFAEEDEIREQPGAGPAWRILVADDDPTVHESTAIALQGAKIAGRPLVLLHAASAAEAERMIAADAALHLILLDVVMESEDAGLRLVPVIRKQLGRDRLHIVIRTGQPGYAPEFTARRDYEIDGYVVKAQLTRAKLIELLESQLGTDRVRGRD